MSWFPVRVDRDADPMRLVREAKERGEDVRLVTGHDPAGDAVVVAWHIVSTNQVVIEGIIRA